MTARRRATAPLVTALVFATTALGAAHSPVPIGSLPTGPVDGITDVPGVRVGQVTMNVGSGPLVPGSGPIRTGATAVVQNANTWDDRVAAATYVINGNGEMTGTHWVNEAGFLETPIVLTNTLNVGRVDDGVVSWMIKQHPQIGIRDDVPLPVVAECDDQGLNDMQGRHVHADDVVAMLDAAKAGDFPRGAVGAGTGMRAFGFKAGIGSSSRVLPAAVGGYTVGVLVNDNTGSRSELTIDGVHVGRMLANELAPVFPRPLAFAPRPDSRAADGSIIIVIGTDAPLDSRQLRELAKRAAFGLARAGATSHTSSGDLVIAFSTTHVYPRDERPRAQPPVVADTDRIDALFTATIDATEQAIDDSLFSAVTTTGANGVTFFGLPYARVAPLLRR